MYMLWLKEERGIVRASEEDVCKGGWNPELMLQVKNSFPSSGNLILLTLGPSTDWMRPPHTTQDSLRYSEFTDLNVNLTHKYFRSNV